MSIKVYRRRLPSMACPPIWIAYTATVVYTSTVYASTARAVVMVVVKVVVGWAVDAIISDPLMVS